MFNGITWHSSKMLKKMMRTSDHLIRKYTKEERKGLPSPDYPSLWSDGIYIGPVQGFGRDPSLDQQFGGNPLSDYHFREDPPLVHHFFRRSTIGSSFLGRFTIGSSFCGWSTVGSAFQRRSIIGSTYQRGFTIGLHSHHGSAVRSHQVTSLVISLRPHPGKLHMGCYSEFVSPLDPIIWDAHL